MPYCKNCGVLLNENSVCSLCGWDLKAEEANEAAAAEAKPAEVVCSVEPKAGRKTSNYVPSWLESFACVELIHEIPISEYFYIWDDVPEEKKHPLLKRLADGFPMKKRHKWRDRLLIFLTPVVISLFAAALALLLAWTAGVNVVI